MNWHRNFTTLVNLTQQAKEDGADDEEDRNNTFHSEISGLVFEKPTDFIAESIYVRAGSEHTIDGERFDLELQIIMKANETSDEP